MTIDKKIFNSKQSDKIVDYFVKTGFCIVRGIYSSKQLKNLENFFKKNLKKFENANVYNKYEKNIFAAAIGEIFNKNPLESYFFENKKLIDLLKLFYGEDIIKIGNTRFQINFKIDGSLDTQVKSEKQNSQFLDIHTDYWTGTSEYSIHYWLPFFGLDKDNMLTVYPGSHLNGPFPVLNRKIDLKYDFLYEGHKLNYLKKGDLVLFHSLMLHKTSGKSKKTRASLLTRFNNLHYKKTNQEFDLGFKTLSLGPLRKIIRLIGNDSLTQFRTYGGKPGIDSSIRHIYDKNQKDIKINSLIKKLQK